MLADSVVNAHSLQKGRATESVFFVSITSIFFDKGLVFLVFFLFLQYYLINQVSHVDDMLTVFFITLLKTI